MAFDVLAQPRSSADVDLLLDEVNASPFIGGWSRHELDHHLETESIRFVYEQEALAGVSAWIVFASGGWCELGPFFALDAFRGRGVGKLVIQIAVETNRDSKRSLYGVTKNPIVKAIFARHGLHETALMRLPLPVMTYLVRKMSPERIARNLRKLNADEHAAHFIALQEAHP